MATIADIPVTVTHRVPHARIEPSGRLSVAFEEARTPVTLLYRDLDGTGREAVPLSLGLGKYVVEGRSLWEPEWWGLDDGDMDPRSGAARILWGPLRPPDHEALRPRPLRRPAQPCPSPGPDPDGVGAAAKAAVVSFFARDVAHDGTRLFRRRPHPLVVFREGGAVLSFDGASWFRLGVPPGRVGALRALAGRHYPRVFAAEDGRSPERVFARLREAVGHLADGDRWIGRLANALPTVVVAELQGGSVRARLDEATARHVAGIAPYVARGLVGALREEDHLDALLACRGGMQAIMGRPRLRADFRRDLACAASILDEIVLPELARGMAPPADDVEGLSALVP